MLRILLVDDMASAKEDIEKGLRRIGVDAGVDLVCPSNRDQPIVDLLPAEANLNTYDLALVDLELFPPPIDRPVGYSPRDLQGGSEVLPWLRREAPWLPVIAESRLYVTEASHFLAMAGSFGFDGLIPRQVFNETTAFDRDMWDVVFDAAKLLRMRALVGVAFDPSNVKMSIDTTDGAKKRLSGLPGWEDVLRATFYFADEVVVQDIAPGFSGALVFRALVRDSREQGGSEGEWIWKVSRNVWKLNREVVAHHRMLRGGLSFARIVPLLWPGVVVGSRIGAIAYKFATGTVPAGTQLRDGPSVSALLKRITPILAEMYRGGACESRAANTILKRELPTGDQMSRIAKQLPKAGPLAAMLRDGQVPSKYDVVVSYRKARIHGDLHTMNVMTGTSDVLIDFALAHTGAIVCDVAKLYSDILVRVPEVRPLFEAELGSGRVAGDVRALLVSLDAAEDDSWLCLELTRIALLKALGYDGCDDEAKEWIKRSVEL